MSSESTRLFDTEEWTSAVEVQTGKSGKGRVVLTLEASFESPDGNMDEAPWVIGQLSSLTSKRIPLDNLLDGLYKAVYPEGLK